MTTFPSLPGWEQRRRESATAIYNDPEENTIIALYLPRPALPQYTFAILNAMLSVWLKQLRQRGRIRWVFIVSMVQMRAKKVNLHINDSHAYSYALLLCYEQLFACSDSSQPEECKIWILSRSTLGSDAHLSGLQWHTRETCLCCDTHTGDNHTRTNTHFTRRQIRFNGKADIVLNKMVCL